MEQICGVFLRGLVTALKPVRAKQFRLPELPPASEMVVIFIFPGSPLREGAHVLYHPSTDVDLFILGRPNLKAVITNRLKFCTRL